MFEGHPSWRGAAVVLHRRRGRRGRRAVVDRRPDLELLGRPRGRRRAAWRWCSSFGLVKRMSTTYLVSTQRLYIRRGMLSKRMQQTRIDRVQNVNTEQSLRERLLRVGTVDFDTAGTDDSEFRFVGIANPAEVVSAVDRAQREPRRRGMMELERAARGVPRRTARELERGGPAARHVARRAAVLLPGLAARARAPGGRLRVLESDGPRAARPDRQPAARASRAWPAPTARRSRSGTRAVTARSSTAPTARSTTRRCARRRPTRCGRGRSGPPSRGRGCAIGELALAPGVRARARRRRLRPPHVPVRPVGLGQDVLARADPRAAAGRHRAAARDPRPELRLRAARHACATGADPELAARYREVARRRRGPLRGRGRRPAAAARAARARNRRTGGAAAARPGRRPRRVRRAGGAARGGAAADARGADGGRAARGAPAGHAHPQPRRGRVRHLGARRARLGARRARTTTGRAAWWSTSARCPRARSRR